MFFDSSGTYAVLPRLFPKASMLCSACQPPLFKPLSPSFSNQKALFCSFFYPSPPLSNLRTQTEKKSPDFFREELSILVIAPEQKKMWTQPYRKSDLEAGARPLYPLMLESPELRWAFIRKVYSILTIQLLATIAVGAVVVFVHPIAHFFVSTGAGLSLYILLILMPFLVMLPLYFYHQKHPFNYLLLGIFTLSLAFAVGLTCAFTSGTGKVILESVILTTVVVMSLTLYTFWAAKRGHDFNFLGPFLFGAVLVLVVFAMIQIFFPLGRISVTIYGCLASLIFCGYIIYDTDNLIKRFSYDEYIWAAICLYLDIINLFLAILTIFRATD